MKKSGWRRLDLSLRVPLNVAIVVGLLLLGAISFPGAQRASASGQSAAEDPSLRTATSRTYLNSDGSYTAQLYPGSVNWEDATGAWQPIDDTLVASSLSGYAYQNKANRYTSYFPPSLDRNPVRFELGGDWMTFSLVGASASPIWVDGATATYANALPGDIVSYSAAPDELQEAISLSGPTSVAVFTFKVQMSSGLVPVQGGQGGVEFRDGSPSGDVVFSFAPMQMYDSAPDPAISDGLSMTLTQNGDGVTIAVVADPTWLSASVRVWPVVIDPTVRLTSPARDCYLGSGSEATQNLCNLNLNRVGYNTTTSTRRTLLFFDVFSAIPAYSTVSGADLSMNLESSSTPSGATVKVHRIPQSWTNAATWNTYDGTNSWTASGGVGGDFDPSVAASNTVSSTPGIKHWYPTSLVQGWVDDPSSNYGLLFKQDIEAVNNVLAFTSADAPDDPQNPRPSLAVTYTAATASTSNPPSSCLVHHTTDSADEAGASAPARSGVRAYIYVPGSKASAVCLRINGFQLTNEGFVELGWEWGRNCDNSRYIWPPQLYTVFEDPTTHEDTCIDLSKTPSADQWHWFRLQYSSGAWHAYLDGTEVYGNYPALKLPDGSNFSSGFPTLMGSERGYDDATASTTQNYANFEKIQVHYSKQWLTGSGDQCIAGGDNDPDYKCVKNPTTSDGDHFGSTKG